MFCGIGPFALRACKLGCKVIANDLNPECAKYLAINAKENKISSIMQFNMDARDFIRKVVNDGIVHPSFLPFNHVYMNLPASAIEFLDSFDGLFTNADKLVWAKMPIIHVNSFIEKGIVDLKEAFAIKISSVLKCSKDIIIANIIDVHNIKDVSTKKNMYCVDFLLPEEVGRRSKKHKSETEISELEKLLKK
jgi:tRNA (guanine37-N1)-methyltransferase